MTWISELLAEYLSFYLTFLTLKQALSVAKLHGLDERSDNLKYADWLRGTEMLLEADNPAIKKLTTLYVTRRFVTVFTTSRHIN